MEIQNQITLWDENEVMIFLKNEIVDCFASSHPEDRIAVFHRDNKDGGNIIVPWDKIIEIRDFMNKTFEEINACQDR